MLSYRNRAKREDKDMMQPIFRVGLFILIGAFLSVPVLAQVQKGRLAPESRYERHLEPRIKQVMKQQGIPGLAIGVVENGKSVYIKGFGVKSLRETYDVVTPQSLFHMASVTKPFVAVAVMQLVEAGLVDLDAPVIRYLPYFEMDDDRYSEITVRQMLSHTSGMPDERNYEWSDPQYDEGALERYVRSLKGRSLIAPPGSQYQYSNAAYEVLGDLISKVSDVTFEAYVAEHILGPLGMEKSTLLLKATDSEMLTSPHILDREYNISVSTVFPYNRAHAPSSTLYSNVLDMSRWAIATLNRGELDSERVLSSSAYDELWKPAGEQWQHVGLGWSLGEHRGHRTIGHSGGDVGFASNMVILPDRNIAIVVMSNYDRAAIQPLTTVALDVALAIDPEPMVGIANMHVDQILYKTIIEDGVEAAVIRHNELKSQPPGFDFNQVRQLNRLGYNLLGEDRTQEAIEIFKLNVAAYPSFAFVYDSLGEAYMRNGDTELAIENYQMVLELNPDSRNAAEMLEMLTRDVEEVSEHPDAQ